MKLDPEERVIAAALGQPELNKANECGAGARIEFNPAGNTSPRRSGWPSLAPLIYPAHIPRGGTDGSA